MDSEKPGRPQVTPHEPEHVGSRRDPEERSVELTHELRDKTLDKTLADSFPTSDPPSTIPDPASAHAAQAAIPVIDRLIADLPPGSWAVISEREGRVLGTGPTQEEAIENAGRERSEDLRVVRVPQDPDAPVQAA
jgi:hypothetical protein